MRHRSKFHYPGLLVIHFDLATAHKRKEGWNICGTLWWISTYVKKIFGAPISFIINEINDFVMGDKRLKMRRIASAKTFLTEPVHNIFTPTFQKWKIWMMRAVIAHSRSKLGSWEVFREYAAVSVLSLFVRPWGWNMNTPLTPENRSNHGLFSGVCPKKCEYQKSNGDWRLGLSRNKYSLSTSWKRI